ncbi:MAG TPA: alpha/beta fold hydrolase [Steroidobacteraceae bacterium]|jgi:pimeloyl-ACP methyl ester carboxylesterase|nr:alpha/beta fold hydrolase [Steroidobacteraceae bacterium]
MPALAAMAAVLLGAGPVSAAPAPSLRLTPCRLTHPSQLLSVEAQCGHLAVPEDPAAPAGRQLQLFVARIPAVSEHGRPDPLFVLAGGPGLAATTFYTGVAPVFERIHRDRDIVLVDQRGTGASNALNCPGATDPDAPDSTAALVQEARSCLALLATHANVAEYTTSLAVRDLDAVRAALGYATINLYGGSYGTRVAQHYLRRYPAHTRAVILDGVVPPQLTLGASLAMDAQSALLRIFSRCVAAAPCHARFGDPNRTFDALVAALKTRAVAVGVPDPFTGQTRMLTFDAADLAAVVRLSSYSTEQTALLPLVLDEAQTHGNFTPVAGLLLQVTHSLDDLIAYGMHNSVVCAEDVADYRIQAQDREQLARTYMGTAQLDALEAICALWPHGPVDADFHQPLASNRPVLLLSGSNDPVTPPAYAAQAARGLHDSLQVVLADMGHGQISAPCAARLLSRFIELGSTHGLQAEIACIQQTLPTAFVTSFTGPPP